MCLSVLASQQWQRLLTWQGRRFAASRRHRSPPQRHAAQRCREVSQCRASHGRQADATGERPVRVRFAPSPTGHLHLGGLRTALYNFLFARAHNGRFILRVEDTDRERLVEGAADRLAHVLSWLAIEPDESPIVGGDAGPYVQSERLRLYASHADELLASGRAYRCFCTEHRLDLLRRESVRARQPNRYDRRCAAMSRQEVDDKLGQRAPHTVRLTLRPFTEPFNDLVYGPIRHDVHEFEGDPVIVKSDGFPTYHLACVVDDHLMQISHVLRGVEWQISTPKHILLYEAFGWTPPHFAHLPLILNSDGTKLSKRQGDIQISHYQHAGYTPESVLNFATLVGGGFLDREHGSDVVYSLDELTERFRLPMINTNSCRIEPHRLNEINRTILRRKWSEQPAELLREARAEIARALGASAAANVSDARLQRGLTFAADRIDVLADLTGKDLAFLWSDRPDSHAHQNNSVNDIQANDIMQVKDLLRLCHDQTDFSGKDVIKVLRKYAKTKKYGFPLLMHFLRGALSGLSEGPPVGEMMEALGYDTVERRLDHTIQKLTAS